MMLQAAVLEVLGRTSGPWLPAFLAPFVAPLTNAMESLRATQDKPGQHIPQLLITVSIDREASAVPQGMFQCVQTLLQVRVLGDVGVEPARVGQQKRGFWVESWYLHWRAVGEGMVTTLPSALFKDASRNSSSPGVGASL
ncbi:unnamed protein product [Symbiodinium natans]|uniref:Uncharacterized protein n=1 Tax=Symbiodinium natans TaxID=878477 RepID=A0A812MTG2_9DINO|nr:unnamed protein product [Symbiodinium natans]